MADKPSSSGPIFIALLAFAALVGIASAISSCEERSRAREDEAREAARLAAMTPEDRAAEERSKAVRRGLEQRAIQAEFEAKRDAAKFDSARAACKHFIEQTLHDPRGAEWPPLSDFNVRSHDSYGNIAIEVTIRGKNAYNATRLATFDCKLSDKGGSWRLESVAQRGL